MMPDKASGIAGAMAWASPGKRRRSSPLVFRCLKKKKTEQGPPHIRDKGQAQFRQVHQMKIFDECRVPCFKNHFGRRMQWRLSFLALTRRKVHVRSN